MKDLARLEISVSKIKDDLNDIDMIISKYFTEINFKRHLTDKNELIKIEYSCELDDVNIKKYIDLSKYIRKNFAYNERKLRIVLYFDVFYNSNSQHNFELSNDYLREMSTCFDSFCWSIY